MDGVPMVIRLMLHMRPFKTLVEAPVEAVFHRQLV